MKSTTNTVSQRFCGKGKDEQAAVSRQLWAWADDVLPRLENRIERECMSMGSFARDMATDAYDYAVQGILNGRVALPRSAKELECLAWHNAKNAIRREYQRRQRGYTRRSVLADESLDEPIGKDASSDFTLTDVASMEGWRSKRTAEELRVREEIALRTLEKVMSLKGYSQRNRSIFRAVFLEREDREDVAARYATTRNNCNQIVDRVKKALNKYGPAIFREMIEAA